MVTGPIIDSSFANNKGQSPGRTLNVNPGRRRRALRAIANGTVTGNRYEQFREDGVLVVEGLLNEKEVGVLRERAEWVARGGGLIQHGGACPGRAGGGGGRSRGGQPRRVAAQADAPRLRRRGVRGARAQPGGSRLHRGAARPRRQAVPGPAVHEAGPDRIEAALPPGPAARVRHRAGFRAGRLLGRPRPRHRRQRLSLVPAGQPHAGCARQTGSGPKWRSCRWRASCPGSARPN